MKRAEIFVEKSALAMDEEVPMVISSEPLVSATSFAMMTMASIVPAPVSSVFSVPVVDPIVTVTPAA